MNIKYLFRKISKSSRWNWLLQFIKFGLVGISNTVLSMGTYYIGIYCLRLHYQISNLLGFMISVTNSYFWNSKYVFSWNEKKTVAAHLRAYFKTVVSYGTVYLLTIFLLWFWVEKMSVQEQIAPILNLLITTPLNYVLNKFWAFRKSKEGTDEKQKQNRNA